jgi:hypothetical protein
MIRAASGRAPGARLVGVERWGSGHASDHTAVLVTRQHVPARMETAYRLSTDLLARIRVPWECVGEVPRAGVAVGSGFDGEQQGREFGGVFLFLGEDALIIVREVGSSWPKYVTVALEVTTAIRSTTRSSRRKSYGCGADGPTSVERAAPRVPPLHAEARRRLPHGGSRWVASGGALPAAR